MGTVTKNKMSVDFLGDKYGISNYILVPDDDPLDNCSKSSHGISPLFSFLSVVIFLLTYTTQGPMLLESLLQTLLESMRQLTFLLCLSLVSHLKSHLEHVSFPVFSLLKTYLRLSILIYKIECLDALVMVRQVCRVINLLL